MLLLFFFLHVVDKQCMNSPKVYNVTLPPQRGSDKSSLYNIQEKCSAREKFDRGSRNKKTKALFDATV